MLTKINLAYLNDNKTDKQREADRKMMGRALTVLKEQGKISESEFSSAWNDNNKITAIPKVVNINFGHIQNFIKSVLVHPLAPDWYVNTVQEYCARNDINFIGKSYLYTFQIQK